MPKPNASSSLAEIKSYVRSHNLNKPEIKLSMRKAELVAGLKKHGHWDGSSTESEATKRSTRPAGQGGMAKRTGGAPGKKKMTKPKGMTMTEWRTDPRNPSRTREKYSGKSGVNPGKVGGDGKTETKVSAKRGRPKGSKNKKGKKPAKLSKGQMDFLSGITEQ